ncbi:hypothetical protein HNR19_002703 [Nocardioides thalensis]|uniref:Integral membrane protein n=1 Tax=Nocardioides thalensis TaxID=1914755 RepID=A0A853C2X4_9ACTN|nr:hypothetical protein [Nocardioides thalensis]NYJ02005.1 hypothetical protein [Nocardioides thalensis]
MEHDARAGERAAAEGWFAHHGLPYFVDHVREDVTDRLSKGWVWLVVVVAVLAGAGSAGLVTAYGDGSWGPVAGVSVTLGVVVLYAVLALHASAIARWALRRALRSLGLLFPLATRALPMLLLFITFLFINTEVWQVSSALHGGVLWGSVLFFALAACAFLVPRVAQELDHFDDRVQVEEVLAGIAGTPMEAAGEQIVHDGVDLPEEAQVTGLQMVNLVLVLVIAQAVQVLLLSLAVFAFFVVFGAVVIDDSVITSWVGHDPTYPPGPELASHELLHVALFLAGFSGLYFTVVAITDDTYRKEFFTSVMNELARAVSMRVIYRMLDGGAGPP